MNMGAERKMKVLDCPRSLGNHFIFSQLSGPLSRGGHVIAQWQTSRSTLGAKDGLCQILSHQNQFSTWCIPKTLAGPGLPWQELAVAGTLNCLFDDLLTMAGLHLLSLAVIRERRKDWCSLLVGHATTALHGELKSGSQYLFNIYIHAYTLISSTPLFSLPTTFPPTSCCFIFNYYFKLFPWDFHNSHLPQNSGLPNPALFPFTSTSSEDFFRLWLLWISLPRAEFSLRKISSSRSS